MLYEVITQSDFVANASHELKTPLSVIIGFIETIKGPAKDDDEARENFLNIMLEQANRMSSLVNDLLSLSKIEMGGNTKFEPVNIGFIADSIQKNLVSKAVITSYSIHYTKLYECDWLVLA